MQVVEKMANFWVPDDLALVSAEKLTSHYHSNVQRCQDIFYIGLILGECLITKLRWRMFKMHWFGFTIRYWLNLSMDGNAKGFLKDRGSLVVNLRH